MIVEPARAKLNLALHVRHRRDDGFHELETLFAFVADGDELRVRESAEASFTLSGPFATALEGAGGNLVTDAQEAFAARFGAGPSLAVELVKRLPVASGIGGGSADAAAMLRIMARASGVAIDDPRLMDVAAGLGSDVPACLLGVTAIGRGRGEQLDRVSGLAGTPVLLVNPGVAVSTGAVFARWDGADRGALGEGDALDVALAGRNDLEAPARSLAPVIDQVLTLLAARGGTRLSRMSGSGATCFALYDGVAARAAAAEAIRHAHPDWWCLETELV